MSRCPFAVQKILPENATQPAITPTQVILHSAVDAPGPTSLFPYFDRLDVGLESHFFVKLNGVIEQYMDTEVHADANLKANVRAVSIETEDEGNPDEREWTPAQMAAIKSLLDWLLKEHKGILPRVCPAWDAAGIGYHTMWGAPSEWTPVQKTCPGKVRIAQFKRELEPWIEAWGKPAPPPPAKRDKMIYLWKKADDPKWYATDLVTRRWVRSRAEADWLRVFGAKGDEEGHAFVVPDDVLDNIPDVTEVV